MIRDKTAIAGIGTTEYTRNIGRTEQETALDAIRAALDDAGLHPRDVDGIFKTEGDSNHEYALARNLGVPNLRIWGASEYGGGGAQAPVVHAAQAVASGMATVAVAFKARNRGSGGRPWASRGQRYGEAAAFETPYGLVSPSQQIAVLARRYMHEFGATPETFARVCVTQRDNATRNPRAIFRSPITVEDVLNSRMIADPLHLLDCCPEIDGACAVVITSAERARDLKQPLVLISAVAQGTGNQHVAMTPFYKEDLWDLPAGYAARDLYKMAGVGPDDIAVAQLYDVFSPLVLFQLEAYGFCKRGEAGSFVEHGGIDWPSGRLPVNTHGGSLSEAYIHGHNHTLEAVRQMRGTSTSQVARASYALVAAAPMTPTSALILRKG
jgi:acetyl-CoA acetyltransferase